MSYKQSAQFRFERYEYLAKLSQRTIPTPIAFGDDASLENGKSPDIRMHCQLVEGGGGWYCAVGLVECDGGAVFSKHQTGGERNSSFLGSSFWQQTQEQW